MQTAIEWFKEKGFSFNDKITIADVIQRDAAVRAEALTDAFNLIQDKADRPVATTIKTAARLILEQRDEELRQLLPCHDPFVAPAMQSGVHLIAKERQRHIEGEYYTSEHDDQHYKGELAGAGAVYALNAAGFLDASNIQAKRLDVTHSVNLWPFGPSYYKPSNVVRNLVKAGALIAAEIDRLLRIRTKNRPAAAVCDEDEELIQQCIETIRSEQKATVSYLQRRLRLGYIRAAKIMDELELRRIVGPSNGAEPREILIDLPTK